MQLFSRNKALFALSLGALAALGACGDDVTVDSYTPPETVSISPPSANMNVGESLVFAVQISGGNATTPATLASCSSSSPSVASAAVAGSTCSVSAVGAGNATITATTSSGKSAAAAVSVAAPSAAINTLSISPTAANLAVNQKVTIVPNVNKAASGVSTTSTFTSSTPAVATVDANGVVTAVAPGVATITVSVTGSGTGYTSTTLTSAATVTVTALPQGITALTVQPSSLTMGVGTKAQISAAAQQPAGAAAASITYGTTDPTIAAVSADGKVSAIAPGSATITVTATSAANNDYAASTLTQLVAVTVNPTATVTITTVTQGPVLTYYSDTGSMAEGLITTTNPQVGAPIDINNVRDQIQVRIHLLPNGQTIDSVVAYIANQDGSSRKAAARQNYSNGTANESDIDFFINTADFDIDWSAGTADIKYPNGVKVLSASVWVRDVENHVSEVQNAENNRQSINFNNVDSWATRYNNPSRASAMGGSGSNSNLNWVGGPGDAGLGNWTIVPVFYTPGRSIQTVTTQLVQLGDNGSILTSMGGANAAGICAARTYSASSALPWYNTYGYGAASGAGAGNATANCFGYEHLPSYGASLTFARNYVSVYNAIDNSNNPAPFVRRYNGFRTNVQRGITAPVANRLDYRVPAVGVTLNVQQSHAETGWVNASYDFAATGAHTQSDNGVGLPTPLGQTYAWTGCTTGNGGSNVSFDGKVKAAAATGEIPECNNNFLGGPTFNGPYTVTATQADVLGNVGTGTSNKFGVDKTNPQIQFTDKGTLTTTAGNNLVINTKADSIFHNVAGTYGYGAAATDSVWSVNALFGTRYRDERAGFAQNDHGTRSITRWAPAASPLLSNVSVATERIATGWQTLNFDGNTGNQESLVDITDPTYRRDSIAIFGNISGAAATDPGYYFYSITVVDRAGNQSRLTRSAAIDITAPQVTGVTIPAVLQGGVALTFNPTGNDDLEAIDGDLFINYPTMAFGGDNTADPAVVANQNGRLRFRRDHFANWHNAWAGASRVVTGAVVLSDSLLSTPFGPAAALSSGGLTMPIPFYQRLEVVQVAPAQENQGPHGRLAAVRMPSQPDLAPIPAHLNWNALNSFKPNLLGVYAFDIRSTGSVAFPTRGMSDETPGTDAAYLENLFAANITQPTAVNFWGSQDVDPITSGTQYLWSWYCFSGSSSPTSNSLECRAETGTNVVNSPFSRVDYYRWEDTASVATTDAAAVRGQWIYLGSVNPNVPTNPIIQDQGVTRFWRFQFSFAGQTDYLQNHKDNAEAALASGDVIRAVGVDKDGNAISTLNYTMP